MHQYRRLVACVLLSVLLHALALVVYQGQTSVGLRVFERRRVPPFEVTLRSLSSRRGPSHEKTVPTKNAPADELSRLRGSSNPADAPAQVKTRPDATGDESAPHIDMQAVRGMVREIERERKAFRAPESQALVKSGLEYETPLGGAIAKAARSDCRVAHAEAGLLAVLFLIKDAITDGGCKW